MGFIDDLKESLTPRPTRYDPPPEPEPYPTAPGRPQTGSGDNEVYLVRVPYPAEGSATVDFALQLMRPAKSIYYPVIMNPDGPLAGYAFNPQGINLSQPIPTTINNPFFDLVPGQLTRWKTAFNKIYVSVNGAGVGGFITLLVSDGMDLITANPAAMTELRKHTTVETNVPLAANALFTGAWHDSQADGTVYVSATALSSSTTGASGFTIDQSDDITNAGFTQNGTANTTVTAATLITIYNVILKRYWRVRFQNAGTAQTSLEVTTTAFNNFPSSGAGNSGTLPSVAVNNAQGAVSVGADNETVWVPWGSAPTPVDILTYGGAFSGTANAALQGYSKTRTPTVFKQLTATAAGNTAIWTPGSGNKFRLLKLLVQVRPDAFLAAAGILVITLEDAATTLPFVFYVFLPAAAPATEIQPLITPWIDLGFFGILSAAANNALNVNLSAAVTNGINVIVCGTEE
jgi:hypothetical protein